MPLPAIHFTPSQQPGQPKLEDKTLADNSYGDLDGILSMLRGSSFSERTAASKNQHGDSEETPNYVSRKSPNSNDGRMVKFDPVVDKVGQDRNLEEPHVSQQIKLRDKVADLRKINDGTTLRDGSINKINPSRKVKASAEDEYSVAGALMQQGATPIHMEGKQKNSEVTIESYEDLVHRILSSQLTIQEICIGIKELQTSVAASSTKGNETSKSIEQLIKDVAKSHDELKLVTEGMRLSNAEDKEKNFQLQVRVRTITFLRFQSTEGFWLEFIILHVKVCAENERNVFMEQLSKEKSQLAERWDSYEKSAALLCAQRKELEMEREAILIEKEKILKEQTKFQQNEALFEQRKIAANEEGDIAAARIATMNEMDAKLQAETKKLLELSDFVARKDAHASQKLAEADALYREAEEHEAINKSAAEVIEHKERQLAEDRYLLIQERVSILKEKASNRFVTPKGHQRLNNTGTERDSEFHGHSSTISDDLLFKRRLSLVKSQLNRLRKE
ncbi:hypothetical protein HJC23_003904 [Cyclotella cryptica]|uniref:Uncharacterized protein n=1 Tax=Cyclotella cryptica TaxID=29204 RepID=A0ABD3PE25_9STRA